MNREIKFRVWDYKYKCWMTSKNGVINGISDFISKGGKGYKMEVLLKNETMTEHVHEEIPFNGKHPRWIIQQYTGLKDKNGKEIFEGDILSNTGWYSPRIVEFGNRLIYTGIESNGEYIYDLTVGFLLRSTTNKQMLDFYFSSKEVCKDDFKLTRTEVIGNIFETQELLKI